MGDTTDEWQRPYFSAAGDKPYVYYVIFGVDAFELKVSKSRHRIDGIPDGLEVHLISRDKHANYMDDYVVGVVGQLLREKNPALYQKVATATRCAVVQGTMDDAATLDYLRNTLGVVQSLTEQNAIAVFDMQVLSWYTPEKWTQTFFAPGKPLPAKHVITLVSKEKDRFWYHTRGMRKFGRPDISVRNVDKGSEEKVYQMINRFIDYYARGGIPEDGQEIRMQGYPKSMTASLKGNFENPDFNNYYIEILWR